MDVTLKSDDPRIGKVIGDTARWPAVDLANQTYSRMIAVCRTLPAPEGEHWFVVLPQDVDEVNVLIEKPKKVKADGA